MWGISKAYTTRVGEGPFPTELKDEIGQQICELGHEYGTTTGRQRRCGWLDLVVVRHSVRLNGITSLAVTKLDVLNGMKSLKVATAYDIDGKSVLNFPASLNQLTRAKPIYQELKGWSDWGDGKAMEIAKKGYGALPVGMCAYLDFISQNTGVPVSIIGIGKERNETIDLRAAVKSRQ